MTTISYLNLNTPDMSGWETVTLGAIANVSGSGVDKKSNAEEEPVRLLNYTDVYKNSTLPTSVRLNHWVTAPKYKALACNIRSGDILLTPTSETTDDIARVSLATEDLPGVCYSYHLVRVRVSAPNVDPAFVAHMLRTREVRSQMIRLASGSGTRYVISLPQFRGLTLALPPLAEQRRIAAALTAADDVVQGYQALIAKKENVKSALMSELLSGERRLPGFEGSWSSTPLGSLAHISTGSRNNQDKIEGGQYPFYVRSQNVERIDTYSYDTEAVLIPGEGNIGSIFHYASGKFEVHQRVYCIRDFKEAADSRFIYWFMAEYFGTHAMSNSVKATVDSLRLPTIQGFIVRVPPFEEQRAIVGVLDAADTELESLRMSLDKAMMVKEALQSDLLSGRRRL
jgi:type I restriction enzyme S subunit